VGSEKLWGSFCQAIGRPDLADHPDYKSNALRVKNRDVLEPMLSGIFKTDTAQNWFEKLTAFGVAASPVRTIDEVMRDPQSAARNMFPQLEEALDGFRTITGLPVKFSATPGAVGGCAPRLGQHTREILAELLDAAPGEMEKLESAGVIRSAPAAAVTVS
jgi:CoA:oxalate CoA-transferase